MATLDKSDIKGAFELLAVVFFLDTILTGFLIPWGLVLTVVLLVLIWLSDSDFENSISNAIYSISSENFLRLGVIVLCLGVLLQNYFIVALGLIVGSMLLFSKAATMEIELPMLAVKTHKK